jgi:hypothetical protein
MTDEPEFRIGDVHTALGGARPSMSGAALDPQVFPTLAGFVSAADFRSRLDALAGQAREGSSPEVQAALQTAVRLLPILKQRYGG